MALEQGNTDVAGINISNLGNGMDTFLIAITGGDTDLFSLDKDRADIGAGKTGTIALTIAPSKAVKAGQYPVTVALKTGELQDVSITVTIKKAPATGGDGSSGTVISMLALALILICVAAVVAVLMMRGKEGRTRVGDLRADCSDADR